MTPARAARREQRRAEFRAFCTLREDERRQRRREHPVRQGRIERLQTLAFYVPGAAGCIAMFAVTLHLAWWPHIIASIVLAIGIGVHGWTERLPWEEDRE